MLLLRVNNYIVLCQVAESSQGQARLKMVGLELQEHTSCHAVEAGRLDDLMASYMAGHD